MTGLCVAIMVASPAEVISSGLEGFDEVVGAICWARGDEGGREWQWTYMEQDLVKVGLRQ